MAASKLRALAAYSACDISDALLKLNVVNAGHVSMSVWRDPGSSDEKLCQSSPIVPIAPHAAHSAALIDRPKVIAPASTVLFGRKSASKPSFARETRDIEKNIPADAHYVDITVPDTVVVMEAPENVTCAALGGIMALRMKIRGARGVIVHGLVRDVQELRTLDLPIWAKGTSTVGAGLDLSPHAIQVPVLVGGVSVKPGDIVFGDPAEGVVVIPLQNLDQVLDMLPRLIAADDKVKEAVRNGMTVKEAFAKFR